MYVCAYVCVHTYIHAYMRAHTHKYDALQAKPNKNNRQNVEEQLL